jgi:hypothetical protein
VTNAFDVAVASIRPSWIQYPGRYEITSIREAFDLESAGRFGNFWSYVDIRDVVSLVRATIESDLDGHEVFNVFGPDNSLPETCDLSGDESAFSTDKAESMLDWEPTHSWRTAEAEAISDPSFV